MTHDQIETETRRTKWADKQGGQKPAKFAGHQMWAVTYNVDQTVIAVCNTEAKAEDVVMACAHATGLKLDHFTIESAPTFRRDSPIHVVWSGIGFIRSTGVCDVSTEFAGVATGPVHVIVEEPCGPHGQIVDGRSTGDIKTAITAVLQTWYDSTKAMPDAETRVTP